MPVNISMNYYTCITVPEYRFTKQKVQILMKCRLMLHSIGIFTVYKCTRLQVSRIKMVHSNFSSGHGQSQASFVKTKWRCPMGHDMRHQTYELWSYMHISHIHSFYIQPQLTSGGVLTVSLSKKVGKDQLLIQSSTTPDKDTTREKKTQLNITHKSQEVSPFAADDHKAAMNRQKHGKHKT